MAFFDFFWGGLTEGFASDLRASLSGKDVPEDIKARLLAMHEENVNAKEQLKTAQEKLVKARAVRCDADCPIPDFS